MPYKPKRPCAYPGCGRLAVSEQYCAEHQKQMDKYYNKYGSVKSYAQISLQSLSE